MGVHIWRYWRDWRDLANTIESFVCSGDAAFLSSYFDHALVLFLVLCGCSRLSWLTVTDRYRPILYTVLHRSPQLRPENASVIGCATRPVLIVATGLGFATCPRFPIDLLSLWRWLYDDNV